MSAHFKKIIGIGSPIMDLLVHVDDDFLLKNVTGSKGGMELVEAELLEMITGIISNTPIKEAPGGSAANTIFALTRMQGSCAFLGKLGSDLTGNQYQEVFRGLGGDCTRFKVTLDAPTAQCLSMVTPDSERTMRTCLGAAALLSPDEITPDSFIGYDHAHLEGYLLFNPALIEKVLSEAKNAGLTISLDLGSFEVVKASANILPALLEKYVDIVFANEEEAAAYAGDHDPQAGLDALSEVCEIAAVKLGADGAFIHHNGRKHRIKAVKAAKVIDTTGAGDYWAAGFLHGYSRGMSSDLCGHAGSILGAAVVAHLGADLPENVWQQVISQISQLENMWR